MRTAFRLTALGIGLVGTVFWLFGGPNLGWTRMQEAVTRKDPVTEIEYTEWQRNFVPGVDFVGAALGLAALVFAGSWLVPGAGRPVPMSSGGVGPGNRSRLS